MKEPSSESPRRSRPSKEDEAPRWGTALGDVGPYLGLGLQIALTMAFYVGAGLGLDFWLGTLPWLTIVGALLGLATMLYHVTRVAGELGKRGEQSGRQKDSRQRDGEERSKEA